MTDLSPTNLSDFLIELCELAALETLPRFRANTGVSNKLSDGFDPVTQADREAERVIRAAINQRFPDHGILGEEHGAENVDADYVWVIDPIDGTRAFISGLPTWGTLIGLTHKGKPIAGVMSQPFTGELFLADSEKTLFSHQGNIQSLATRKTHELDQAILMTTTPELFSKDERPRFDALAENCKLVRYGFDCYGYAMVASGHVDLVVESGLQAYDIVALIPVIEQAGGVVTNWQGGSAAKGGQVIAASSAILHEKALAILNL